MSQNKKKEQFEDQIPFLYPLQLNTKFNVLFPSEAFYQLSQQHFKDGSA
jgi:hypothetical protein